MYYICTMENNQVKELIAFIRTLCDEDGKFNEETKGWKDFYDLGIGRDCTNTIPNQEIIPSCYDSEEDMEKAVNGNSKIDTSRSRQELFFINQVCKKYSQLLSDVRLQYLEVGTYHGASAIATCWENKSVKVWTIDSYESGGTHNYSATPEDAVNNFMLFNVKDSVTAIIKDSAEILHSDLVINEQRFVVEQGIHVFFYDGCDDNEEKIRQTFINLIPLMSDVCICIFDQKTVSERKPNLSCLFKEVLGEKITPEQFKEVSFNPPKSYGSSQFHCYLLKKNR